MGIDIDGFLEKYSSGKSQTLSEVKSSVLDEKKQIENKINLDFQEDIENRLASKTQNLELKDIEFLKNIYDEVKKFDEELPTKFLSIEGKSSEVLKTIGVQYSNEFFKKSKEYVLQIVNQVELSLQNIDALIEIENYSDLMKEIQNAKNFHMQMPPGFIKEKTEMILKIREREIEIYEAFLKYKNKRIPYLKNKINNQLDELKNCLMIKDLNRIENILMKTNVFITNLPKILLIDLIDEHKSLIIAIGKVEKYFEEISLEEFGIINDDIEKLFSRFQNSYLKKDLDSCIIIYDEIIMLFQRLPDINLERKTQLYNKINEIHASINNLILDNNMNTFLEAYKTSKALDEIRIYVEHMKNSDKIEIENLDLIKQRLKSIPTSYGDEKTQIKEDLIKELERIKANSNRKVLLRPSVTTGIKKEEINALFFKLRNSKNYQEADSIYDELKKLVMNMDLSSDEKKKIFEKIKQSYSEIRAR